MRKIALLIGALFAGAWVMADSALTIYDNAGHYLQIQPARPMTQTYNMIMPPSTGTVTQALSITHVSSNTITLGWVSGGGGGGAVWGGITGTISNQADLQNVFNSIAASTTTLKTGLNAVGVSTGTLLVSINALSASTTSLRVSITALGVSTGTLLASVNALGLSTGTLSISTVSLQNQINSKINFSSITASQPAFWNPATGVVSVSGVSLSTGVVGILPIANGGTGTSTPAITAGTNITSITGTWPNVTINASGGSSGSGGYNVQPASVAFNLAQGVQITTATALAFNSTTSSFSATGPGGLTVHYGATVGSMTVNGSGAGQLAITQGMDSSVSPASGVSTLWATSSSGTLVWTDGVGVSTYVIVGSSVNPTPGQCGVWSATGKLISGPCGSGSGGSGASGTITASPQYSVAYYSLSGSTTTVTGSSNFSYDGSTLTVANVAVTTFTNVSSFTVSGAYFDVSASTTNLGRLKLNGSSGISGQVLTSSGTSIPAWTYPLAKNVKDYGCSANGIADDSLCFQTALNAAKISSGTIYVPAGNYFVHTFRGPNATDVLGISDFNSLWSISIICQNGANITTDQVGSDVNTPSNIIDFAGGWNNSIIQNCQFSNTHGSTANPQTAITIGGGGGQLAKGNQIIGNTFSAFSRSVTASGVTGIQINGNRFLMPSGKDSGTTGTDPNVGVWFFNNGVNGNSQDVIVANNYYNGCVSGSVAANTTKSCGDGFFYGAVYSGQFTGNVIRSFSYEGGFIQGNCASGVCNDFGQKVIANNVIDGTRINGDTVGGGQYGIRVDASNSLIIGNKIGNVQEGILDYWTDSSYPVGSSADNITIEGNAITISTYQTTLNGINVVGFKNANVIGNTITSSNTIQVSGELDVIYVSGTSSTTQKTNSATIKDNKIYFGITPSSSTVAVLVQWAQNADIRQNTLLNANTCYSLLNMDSVGSPVIKIGENTRSCASVLNLSGTSQSNVVITDVGNTAPTNGQVMAWTTASNSWDPTTVSGGSGGSSSLGIFNGSVLKSSPTSGVTFDSNTFTVTLQGSATAAVTLNSSSVTLQGAITATTLGALTTSSATATYLQSSSATLTYCFANGKNCTATGTPGSPNYSVQFASASVFTGSSNFTYDGSTLTVSSVSSFTVSNTFFDVSASTLSAGRLYANLTAGTSGQFLTSQGVNQPVKWTTGGSGGSTSPGGSNGQIQFNNSSSFGGITGSFVTASSISYTGAVMVSTLAVNAVGTNVDAPIKIGPNASLSTDGQVVIGRNVDNTGNVFGANAHGFSDSSIVTRNGSIGYNSYDARTIYNGVGPYDHYAAFQSAYNYNSTSTISNLYGFIDSPQINNSGNATNRYGFVAQEIAAGSTGKPGNDIGFYVGSDFTNGTSGNFGFYGAGHYNYMAGLILGGNNVYFSNDTSPNLELASVNGTASYIRIWQNSNNAWDIKSVASSSRLGINDANNVEYFTMLTGGNVGIGNTAPASKFHVSSGVITTDGSGSGLNITNGVAFTQSYKAAVCQAGTASLGFSTFSSSGPTAACVISTSTVMGIAPFVDTSSMSVQDHFTLPTDWVGAVNANILWNSTTTTNSVVWQIRTGCASNSQAAVTWNSFSTVTDAAISPANALNSATLNNITTTGCVTGNELFFELLRDPTNASDTLTATSNLVTLQLSIRRSLTL